MQVLVLNGVNLNTLGKRDPTIYGTLTLNELETQIYTWGHELGLTVRCRQSNHEGEFIGWIHDALGEMDGVVVNPGAWSHYAYSIRDALDILTVPIVEVHLSNIHEREEWRHHTVIEDVATHRIVGKGAQGYKEALEFIAQGGTA
ncbi:MAG: type II 3-dehydroquinate dehydratase [Actinobacteria bacterium]|uniref:3-dehydroquinate dehydratase n=1 Tax=freshwater metagenome TaxID=449393 RepID=A0A6J6P5C4_9ZZZZ|nr:type II 3-dehydroquinate dehydratase [Actinomycetota bacterium]